MPDGIILRIAWTRPSQWLKSPTTDTRWALGAQTAKWVPATPPSSIMCAPSFLVDFVVRAFIEEIDVHLAKHGTEGIGILLSPRFPGVALHFQHVVERLLNSAQDGLKQAVRMDLVQREAARHRPPHQRSRLPRHPGEERVRTGFPETPEFPGV